MTLETSTIASRAVQPQVDRYDELFQKKVADVKVPNRAAVKYASELAAVGVTFCQEQLARTVPRPVLDCQCWEVVEGDKLAIYEDSITLSNSKPNMVKVLLLIIGLPFYIYIYRYADTCMIYSM